MNLRTTSKSSLFLMELILAIFFFSLASAVCIQLFVKAHILGKDTTNLNHGVLWTQNIAEAYLGNDGDFEKTLTTLNGVSDASDSFSLYFDENWNQAAKETACYRAIVQDISEAELQKASITIQDQTQNEIYSLTVSHHLPAVAEKGLVKK